MLRDYDEFKCFGVLRAKKQVFYEFFQRGNG